MRDYTHLIGRDFVWGSHDCYGLVRDFYRDVFDIELPDFARPEDFWSKGLDLFAENYIKAGFELLERVHPADYQNGDVLISAVQSPIGNHASIIVENGQIFHHLFGGISRVDHYRGLVRNTLVGVYRHPDVAKVANVTEQRDIRDFLSPNMQRRLDAIRNPGASPIPAA